MRRASELERRSLNDTFAALCAIRSPWGEERVIADDLTRRLQALGLDVEEDDTAPLTGAGAGNLLARIPGRDERTVLLCAHMDTVPHEGVVEPVLDDGAWVSAGDTILGADNKAAVAVFLEVARRAVVEPPPVGIELLFTASEENALAGSRAFDASRLRADLGYVLDQASPIGEIVMGSPTSYQLEATFHGQSAHAGVRPEDGRSAIVAAARAIAHLPQGRVDEQSSANVGWVRGGGEGTNVVAAHAAFAAEVRSHDPARADELVAQMVDAIHDAANEPFCACDVDLDVERVFPGYRHANSQLSVVAAENALRACGYEPRRILTGGASDANNLEQAGLPVTNLANGTERNHRSDERVSVVALEGMLDVVLALIEELG
ncbi:MAG TPA: M20/M25/M40 family metallo-hydrolase [Solirubrobacteraceae bacterium]